MTETESKIKGDGNVDAILEKQEEKLKGEADFVQKCVHLLKTEPLTSNYELNLNKSKVEKITRMKREEKSRETTGT